MNPAQQFKERHGEHVFNGGWLYFANGAMMEFSPHGGGGQYEPPAEPGELARRIAKFHEGRVREAVTAFDEFKRQIGFPRSEERQAEALAQLQRLADEVARRKQVAEQARQADPNYILQQRRKEADLREAAERQQWQQAVASIRV